MKNVALLPQVGRICGIVGSFFYFKYYVKIFQITISAYFLCRALRHFNAFNT